MRKPSRIPDQCPSRINQPDKYDGSGTAARSLIPRAASLVPAELAPESKAVPVAEVLHKHLVEMG
jgi:hypothetical protein